MANGEFVCWIVYDIVIIVINTSGPASKGYPLYAELKHKKRKQSITSPDMQYKYSEIKTDRQPIVLIAIISV